MSKIKLLALDLDGTLLTHDKQISTENKVAIKQAQAAGVHVVITTGRPLKAIEHILKELDLLVASEYSIPLTVVWFSAITERFSQRKLFPMMI